MSSFATLTSYCKDLPSDPAISLPHRGPRARRERLVALAAAILLVTGMSASRAAAQWIVTNLHPAGASSSYAYGVSGGQQVGYAIVAGQFRASLWSGTAASWVDLTPDGATESQAFGVSDTQQVGRARVGGRNHASLWNGTAASWLDLHPAGATGGSTAYGVSGGQQVGSVGSHASLWSGTAASWVDLHPPGSPTTSVSVARSTDGRQQAGDILYTGELLRSYASLWSGTAASWEILDYSQFSFAYGVFEGQQVGSVGTTARLWRGSADSWVDLDPGTGSSTARGVFEGQQVGDAQPHVNVQHHASLWRGSAESWVDLHYFLPPEFSTYSVATSIWSDADFTYVAGYGFNNYTGRDEALLWTGNNPTFDIRPGACPNLFNRAGHGVLPAAIVGSPQFDVEVILPFVQLARADGVGGFVFSHQGPPGPHSTIHDVTSPSPVGVTSPCNCPDNGADGIPDLVLYFNSDEITEQLQLGSLDPGAVVELVATGYLLPDFQLFTLSDCIRLVPPGTPPGMLQVSSTVPKTWIDSSPPDLQMDGGGFASFERTFPVGTLVTLTADNSLAGTVFAGWQVDGQMVPAATAAIQVYVSAATTTVVATFVEAVRGDMDGDGAVTPADVQGFVATLLALPNLPVPILTADMTSDGSVDGRDIAAFVTTLLVP